MNDITTVVTTNEMEIVDDIVNVFRRDDILGDMVRFRRDGHGRDDRECTLNIERFTELDGVCMSTMSE